MYLNINVEITRDKREKEKKIKKKWGFSLLYRDTVLSVIGNRMERPSAHTIGNCFKFLASFQVWVFSRFNNAAALWLYRMN